MSAAGAGSQWIGKACAMGRSLGLSRLATKKVDFKFATTGAMSSIELFTVGGTIAATAFGVCGMDLTSLSGTATIQLGTENDTNQFLAAATATGIDSGEIYADGTTSAQMLWSGVDSVYSIIKNADIGYTIATADIDSGQITFYCIWSPISEGAWLDVQETEATLLA